MTRPGRPGLLLGYAGLSPEDIATAMQLFGQCLDELGLPRGGPQPPRMVSNGREKSAL